MTPRAATAELLTPRGQGGIGVVAVTGRDAADAVAPLFANPHGRTLSNAHAGDLLYGTLRRGDDMLDEVVICARSEDRFEINCHGGVVPLRRVLAALQDRGVSLAERRLASPPGATDDAVRDEAAALLPDASTRLAAHMLLDQWHGALSSALAALLHTPPAHADAALRTLAQSASLGLGLCAPPRLVVAGAPNVGKSTLVNRLLAEERMIVHDRPGTTRDVVEQLVAVRGYPLVLADTAGIGDLAGPVDAVSVERSLREVRGNDLVLIVRDAARPDAPEPEGLRALARHARVLPVLNKADLAPEASADALRVSALTGEGFDALEEALLEMAFPVRWMPGAPAVFTPRQQDCIARALAEPARRAAWLKACLHGEVPPG